MASKKNSSVTWYEEQGEYLLGTDPLAALKQHQKYGNKFYINAEVAIHDAQKKLSKLKSHTGECLQISQDEVRAALKSALGRNVQPTDEMVNEHFERIRAIGSQLETLQQSYEQGYPARIRESRRLHLDRAISLVQAYLEDGTYFGCPKSAMEYLDRALTNAELEQDEAPVYATVIRSLHDRLNVVQEKKDKGEANA